MELSFATVAAIAFAFLIAGLVKGVLGLGLPTVSIALLSLAMSPARAVALMLVPALLTNIWQGLAGGHLLLIVRRLWPTLLAILVGTWIAAWFGVGLLSAQGAGGTRLALGLVLVIYAAIGLSNVRLQVSARLEPWLGTAVGLATGMISAFTGIYMLPAVPYYQAVGFEPNAFVQVQGVSYTFSSFALVVLLMSGDVLDRTTAGTSLLALIPAALGMLLGQAIRTVTRPKIFRLCFYLAIGALGVHLAFIHR